MDRVSLVRPIQPATQRTHWEGEAQTRVIDKLTADEFVNTNPNVAGGRGSASNFYRRVK